MPNSFYFRSSFTFIYVYAGQTCFCLDRFCDSSLHQLCTVYWTIKIEFLKFERPHLKCENQIYAKIFLKRHSQNSNLCDQNSINIFLYFGHVVLQIGKPVSFTAVYNDAKGVLGAKVGAPSGAEDEAIIAPIDDTNSKCCNNSMWMYKVAFSWLCCIAQSAYSIFD